MPDVDLSAAPSPRRPGMARCLASMFYEALLLIGVLAALLVLPHVLVGAFLHRLATPIVLQAHFFLVLLLYFVWYWSNGGQTLAMKTWRIRLISTDGRPVRPIQALWRFLLCWPSLALV
ncbi:MAG: RDD family protein, partial [Candidatus Accumulibacter sp.]|nr:RDD family protein [Accumulibacter sp.]